jgi:hypothetical protein
MDSTEAVDRALELWIRRTTLERTLDEVVPRHLRELPRSLGGPLLTNTELFSSKRAALVDEDARTLWEALSAIYEAEGYDGSPSFVPFAIDIETYFLMAEKCRVAATTPEGSAAARAALAKAEYGGLSYSEARKKYLKRRMDAANEGY